MIDSINNLYGLEIIETKESNEEYQPNLNSELTYMDIQAGGHLGNIYHKDDRIYKITKIKECENYKYLFSDKCCEKISDIKKFLPKYLGAANFDGKDYIILENLHYGYDHPNLIDCKVGKRTWDSYDNLEKIEKQKEKNLNSICNDYSFRITGLVIRNKDGKIIEQIRKEESLIQITKRNVKEFFIKLTSYDDLLQINLVKDLISQTENILEFFKKQNIKRFYASSVYYVIGKNNKAQARYIDIAKIEDSDGNLDYNVIEGLEGLLSLWKSLLE